MGWFRGLSVLALAMMAAGAAADPARLNIYYDDSPPLEIAQASGHPRGVAAEILDRAAAIAGIAVDYHKEPWARSLNHARTEGDACVIGAGRTPEREDEFQWVGPFLIGGLSLFSRDKPSRPPESIKQVIESGARVGIAQEDIATSLAAKYPNLKVVQFLRNSLGTKMLEAGRFEYWASGRTLALYQLKLAGAPVNEVLRLSTVSVAMACNLSADRALLGRLQSAFDSLAADGSSESILDSYLGGGDKSSDITIVYTVRRPYIGTNPDGSPGGLLAEPARRVFAAAGLSLRWIDVPQQRVLPMLQNSAAPACSPGWYYTAGRAGQLRYSDPFFQDRPQVALLRGERGVPAGTSAASLLARPDLRIALRVNMSHGDYLDGLIGALPADRVRYLPTDIPAILRMVVAGRADLTFLSGDEVEDALAEAGVKPGETTVLTLPDVQKREPRYIVCSPSVPPSFIERLNRAIKDLGLP